MTMTLREQHQMQLLMERLSPEEIRKFAGVFQRINKILADKDLPSLKNAVEQARNALADVAEKGVVSLQSIDKAKTMSDLVLLQSMIVQLFRMIPSIMELVGTKQEIARRLRGMLIMEKDEPFKLSKKGMTMKQLASELDITKDELMDVMRELGISTQIGGRAAITPDQAQEIFVALTSVDVKGTPPAEQTPVEKAAAGAQKNPQLKQKIEQLADEGGAGQKVVDALGGEASDQVRRLENMIKSSLKQRGFLKGLFLGRMPFGLDQQDVVNDFLDMPWDQFQALAKQTKAAGATQVGISSDDAKEVATAVKGAKGEDVEAELPQRASRDQIVDYILKKRPKAAANKDVLLNVLKLIPDGTVIS